jgi:antitoxin (DNA-binding transcriptional repressor) of toxin-antitoxin stability system
MRKVNPTINLRELRDTRQLKAWLRSGHTVELRERDRLLASIVPVEQAETKEWPDFAARTKKLFGGRRLPGADLLIQERGRF